MGKNDGMSSEQPAPSQLSESEPGRSGTSAREINDSIRYTLFSVFSRVGDPDATVDDAAGELQDLVDALIDQDVQIRGFYDVSALRADADLMIWSHAASAEQLQDAVRRFRRTATGRALTPAWSAMGLHRPAEFNKGHVPAFLTGKDPQEWLSVYPFVRSYEWYLLPDEERRSMLVEHGMMGRGYDQVLSNTVAAFSLGDYEWLLALEARELHDIVDLMRHLRSAKARLHVREEIPFFTGHRIDVREVCEVLT